MVRLSSLSAILLSAPLLVPVPILAAAPPHARSQTTTNTNTIDVSSTYTDFTSIFQSLSEKKKGGLPKSLAAAEDVEDPPVPDGYEFTFGPLEAANNAPFYMGFVSLPSYDVQACADACNAALPDSSGGYCSYFNIWQAVINGSASDAICAKYYVPTNSTTATNTGSPPPSPISITLSRAYTRLSLLPDGTFESYTCPLPSPQGPNGCYTTTFQNWLGTSDPGGFYDATIQYFNNGEPPQEVLIGHSTVLLGAVYGNTYQGTLSTLSPLETIPGESYVLGFHHRSRHVPQPGWPDDIPGLSILWNGRYVDNIIGYYESYTWKGYAGLQAVGNDTIAFHGGVFPSGVELDNIFLFKA